jgi:hypothetical protein
MSALATILALTSGLFLMRVHESAANLIATSLVVDAALAPVTAIVAARRSRSAMRWAIIGFVFGIWALGWALVFMPDRSTAPASDFPPTSDAA